jgi:multidrug efflux pump subunit AcrA (membrane-fusion protein)
MRASFGALAVLVVLALMAISFAAGLVAGTPTTTPTTSPTPAVATPTPTPVRPTPSPSPTPLPGIVASAVVIPQRSVDVAAPITATVEQVFVAEDQQVRQDQLLLRLDGTTRRAQVDVAEADLRRARAAQDRAQVVVDQLPEDASLAQREQAAADLRLAEADVALAVSALEAARVALTQTEIRAPWAGTVAALNVGPGEQAVVGQALVTIADFSGWLFETTDVSEFDVVRVAVGDQAVITVAALPDLELAGEVEQVRVRGGTGDGGVRFDVIVRPLEHVAQLRWNMSASVRILPGSAN